KDMKITCRKVNHDALDDFILIAGWSNDESIKHFAMPDFTGGGVPAVTAQELFGRARAESGAYQYMILADDSAIGEFSIQIDPPQLFKKVKNTGWIGITIGRPEFRGRGIGRTAIGFIEDECRKLKLSRIELGVFEFNHNAIRLYRSTGYTEIGAIDKFTCWQGKWYKDIRMEKYL
ncbi:MAG TPA: GNAT family N-acetyltransferase, partial [Candidatus Wallbacteria bacterium]|nr:GNAT family N-acetyltransferase [Candidatus Wallbacteria bacterium]